MIGEKKISFYISEAKKYNKRYEKVAPLTKIQLAKLIAAKNGGDEKTHYYNLLRINL